MRDQEGKSDAAWREEEIKRRRKLVEETIKRGSNQSIEVFPG